MKQNLVATLPGLNFFWPFNLGCARVDSVCVNLALASECGMLSSGAMGRPGHGTFLPVLSEAFRLE